MADKDSSSKVSLNLDDSLSPGHQPSANETSNSLVSKRAFWTVTAIAVTALILGGALAYGVNQLSEQLSEQQALLREDFETRMDALDQSLEVVGSRLQESGDRMATLGSQIQVTMDRVGVTQTELGRARALADRFKEEQDRSVEALTREIESKASLEEVVVLERESGQRFEEVDQEITTVKGDVQSTRQDLIDTMAELSSLGVVVNEQGQMVATNLTGVEELRRRGERDYATVDLQKNVRTRVAGIVLELRDTDGGDAPDADIRIYADDTGVERKDIPQNTPVNFYVGTERIPYELVLNEISNKPDWVRGYISVPKGNLPEGAPRLRPGP